MAPPLPHSAPPFGLPTPVAPGVLWLRLPLPFRLDHVNVYLVADRDGWLLIDTGPDTAEARAIWSTLLDGRADGLLAGRPITRILATHHHPDHVGAADTLQRQSGALLLMSEVEYLIALHLVHGDEVEGGALRGASYKRHGASPERVAATATFQARYRNLVPALPRTFEPVRDGDTVEVDRRPWTACLTGGHSPAQVALHDPASNMLFVADEVLTRITPNVGVLDRSPEDDTLRAFLESLAGLKRMVPDGGLVLPGHGLPFRSLHTRIDELVRHHDERCRQIEQACSARALTAAELVAELFPFPLDDHQFGFALSEVLSHLNHLARQHRIEPRDAHGKVRWGSTGRPSHQG